MTLRYQVDLSEIERCELQAMLMGGKHAARTLDQAQNDRVADTGICGEIIASTVAVGASTLYRTKRRSVEDDLERALREERRTGAAHKLSGKDEALLVATACSSRPEARARWTLELLSDTLVQLTGLRASRVRPCGAASPRTRSSPRDTRCGASPRSMASTLPAWKTFLIFMPSPLVQNGWWCALTRA